MKPLNPANFPHGVIEIPEGDRGVYLGRDASNDAQLNVEAVSSRHARLLFSGERGLELYDCDSSNGTFVNGVKIQEKGLVEGDVVKLASAEFRVVELNGSSTPAAPVTKGIPLPARPASPVSSSVVSTPQPEKPSEPVPNQEVIALQAGLAALKAGKETLAEEGRKVKRDLAESQDRERTVREQLSEARAELLKKEQDIAGLTYELSQRESSLATLQEEKNSLGAELSALQATHRETCDLLEQKSSSLMVALQRVEVAESSQSALFARTRSFVGRLVHDWKEWTGDAEYSHSGQVDGIDSVFGEAEELADRIRGELDLIEPIWHEFGDGVQKELQRRCSDLEKERGELEKNRDEKLSLFEKAEEDLNEIRAKVDGEVRRAHSLSRKGTEVAIPERFESMVIASDREQEIFRLLVGRVDEIDQLVESYSKSKKYRDIHLELKALQEKMVMILDENGVSSFEIEPGTMLNPKHRKSVQIVVKKGWGTREYMEQPFHPGEVRKVVRHGYRMAEGDDYDILRKVEVLIREVGVD